MKSSGQETGFVVNDTSLKAVVMCSLYAAVGTAKHFELSEFSNKMILL